jgi:osmotically-inducible protein OsmY
MKTRLSQHTLTLALSAALLASPFAMAQDAKSDSSKNDTMSQTSTTHTTTKTTPVKGSMDSTDMDSKTTASTDKSAGTVVDDATVTAEVKSKLLANGQTHALNINVDTDNGVVTLAGTAMSVKEKSTATSVAHSVSGVKSVKNQLVVSKDSSANPQTLSAKTKAEAGKAGDSSKDGWVTTKVKSKFAASSAVKASDISVETSNGVVTLTGQVDSDATRQAAVQQAKETEGVKSVNASGLTVAGSPAGK